MEKETVSGKVAEGNRLIDVFVAENGFIGKEYTEHYSDEFWRPTTRKYEVDDLQYHSSWDWLMPVVDKITGIAADVYGVAEEKELYEQCGSVMSTNVCVGKEVLWNRIIQFIQWYSSLSKSKQKAQ